MLFHNVSMLSAACLVFHIFHNFRDFRTFVRFPKLFHYGSMLFAACHVFDIFHNFRGFHVFARFPAVSYAFPLCSNAFRGLSRLSHVSQLSRLSQFRKVSSGSLCFPTMLQCFSRPVSSFTSLTTFAAFAISQGSLRFPMLSHYDSMLFAARHVFHIFHSFRGFRNSARFPAVYYAFPQCFNAFQDFPWLSPASHCSTSFIYFTPFTALCFSTTSPLNSTTFYCFPVIPLMLVPFRAFRIFHTFR